jgi:hypothetical protein
MIRSAAPQRDKKTGRWFFVLDIPPGPDGRRRQARRRGFVTKREAQAALDELRINARTGNVVQPSKLSLAAYLDGWLGGMEVAGRAAGTLASYRRNLATHVVPHLGGLKLQALQPTHLDQLYARLLNVGRRDGKGGLSSRTVRYVHTILRKALADAVRKGLVVRNVADLADPPTAKSAKAPEDEILDAGGTRSVLGGGRRRRSLPPLPARSSNRATSRRGLRPPLVGGRLGEGAAARPSAANCRERATPDGGAPQV